MRIWKSKKFWIGAVTGTVAGGWALGMVGVSVPKFRGRV